MQNKESIQKAKGELTDVIKVIESNSPVGIDTQYTHAIIIDYLRQIQRRLDVIESKILK